MKQRHLTQTDVIARGWTRAVIEQYMPYPDKVTRSFAYHSPCYLYAREKVEGIENTPEWQARTAKVRIRRAAAKEARELARVQYLDQQEKTKAEREARVAHISLIDAIRDISRAAHKYRDEARVMWAGGRRYTASIPAAKKRECYRLKERGIVAAHKRGLLRYAGVTPQGMAVYEYAEGGMSCFHSCLHPAAIDRVPVPDHPDILFVEAKSLKHDEEDVRYILAQLSDSADGYERVRPPRPNGGTDTHLHDEREYDNEYEEVA
jgi:hypothetical protein